MLLEFETALDMYERGDAGILPLLLGEERSVEGESLLAPFRVPRADAFPCGPHAVVGGGGRDIRQTLSRLFSIQGVRVDNPNPTGMELMMIVTQGGARM